MQELSQAGGVVFTREAVNDVLSRGIENKEIKARGSTAQLIFFFLPPPPHPLFFFFILFLLLLIPGSRRGTNHNNTGVFLQDFNLILVGDKKLEYFW